MAKHSGLASAVPRTEMSACFSVLPSLALTGPERRATLCGLFQQNYRSVLFSPDLQTHSGTGSPLSTSGSAADPASAAPEKYGE
jgi:hypothetical protein